MIKITIPNLDRQLNLPYLPKLRPLKYLAATHLRMQVREAAISAATTREEHVGMEYKEETVQRITPQPAKSCLNTAQRDVEDATKEMNVPTFILRCAIRLSPRISVSRKTVSWHM